MIIVANKWYNVAKCTNFPSSGIIEIRVRETIVSLNCFIDEGSSVISVGNSTIEDGSTFSARVQRNGNIYLFDFSTSFDYELSPAVTVVGEDWTKESIAEAFRYSIVCTLDDIANINPSGTGSFDPTQFVKKRDVIFDDDDISVPSNDKIFSALRSLLEHLSKKHDDTAEGKISFMKGIDVNERALFNNSIRVLEEALFKGSVSSDSFASGFLGGHGWAILQQEFVNVIGETVLKSIMELDELTIRGALRAYELVISQLSGENGTRLTTDMMKVYSIDVENKKIYLDTEKGMLNNPFRQGDILMVQRFGGMPTGGENNLTKSYELAVSGAGRGEGEEDRLDWITFDSFLGDMSDVAARDVLTRVDSYTDKDRKGIIKHTSVEPGSPYIEVIEGMKTDLENAIKVRLGRLDGIINEFWGQLKGFGLCSTNAYLLGDFRLRTGDDVRTLLEIIEGMFRSAMQSVVYDFTEEDNFLTNATFTHNMEGWVHHTDIVLFSHEGVLIDMGTNFLSSKINVSEVVGYDGRQMLRLRDGYIRQFNALLTKPEAESVIYLSFKYRCITKGTLTVGFENMTEGGDFSIRETLLSPNSEYETYNIEGRWDGSGDFYLGFTGDIYIELLSFANRPLDDFKRTTSTLFEQTNEYIQAVATEVSELDGYVKEAGFLVKADAVKIFASEIKESGEEIIASINVSSEEVKIKARNIALEGLTTVNDHFKILEDGTMVARGGIFSGFLKMPFVDILSRDADGEYVTEHMGGGVYKVKKSLHLASNNLVSKIILPTGIDYNGAIVNIVNTPFPPYVKGDPGRETTVVAENSNICIGTNYNIGKGSTSEYIGEITFKGAIMQFVAVPITKWNGSAMVERVQWVAMNCRMEGANCNEWLACGSVARDGTHYGTRGRHMKCEPEGLGKTIFTHSIGHTGYNVQVTPRGSFFCNTVIESGTRFRVETTNSAGALCEGGFSYLVL